MEKDKEKKKTSLKPSKKTSAIDTNPQLPGVNEQGSAVAKDPIVEKVLNLAQRRKRALIMRKNKPRIERAREMAKTRFAPEKRLKKRAQEMARTIVRRKFAGQRGLEYATLSPSDKINVDKLIDKKVALIKKIADRLMPRVKKHEVERLQAVRTGKKAVQQGALGRSPLMQSMEFKGLVDALLTEEYNDKMEKLLRLGLGDKNKLNQYRQALKDPENSAKYVVLRKHLLKMLDKLAKLVTDDPTVFQKSKAKLQKERDYEEKDEKKVEESLQRKANKSGIDYAILEQVFNRGYDSWNPSMKITAEQFGFGRVNSFISGGKARELDADLIEKEVWDKPNPVQKAGKSSKLSPAAKAKAKARAKAAGRPYPNMVDNIWAARNEEIEVNPKIKDKTKKKEIYTLPTKTMDPMTEKTCEPKPLLSKIKKWVKK